MNKYLFLVRPRRKMEREEASRHMLGSVKSDLLALGPSGLIINVTDPESDIPSPAPGKDRSFEPVALVDIWLPGPDEAWRARRVFDDHDLKSDGYLVEESIYREYGDNEHHRRRDWQDGVRSPGITAVTILKKPKRLDREEWIRRWHGRMSPVSERIQPRARYVRNLVLDRLNGDAEEIDGIVSEVWPTPEHVTNPYLFYGAKNIFQLVKNVATILVTVLSILDLMKIRTYMMGEYFIKTDFSSSSKKGGETS